MTEPALTRAERSETQLSLGLALAVIAVAAMAAVVLFTTSAAAGWVAGIGAVMVGGGVIIPQRVLLGGGTVLLAIGSLVATAGAATFSSLVVNAIFAFVCSAVLLGADLSYVARRSTVISPIALEGFVTGYLAATVAGVVLSVVLLAVVLAVVWPAWLLVVPAAALLVGSLALVRSANHYQRNVNLAPQAAAPSGPAMPDPRPAARSVMPPPPRPADRVHPRSIPMHPQAVPPPPNRLPPPPPPPNRRPPPQLPPPPGVRGR